MTLNIGHRGAAGLEPENTLRSFRKALAIRVDAVECDVWLSKDGQVVVIHDPTLQRTTNGRGKVNELTLVQMRKFDAGKGEKIPTLEEVITVVKGKCALTVEIKDPEAVEPAIKIVRRRNFLEHTTISSKFVEVLQKAKAMEPRIQTALIFYPVRSDLGQKAFDAIAKINPATARIILGRARKAPVGIIDLCKDLASPEMIAFLHRQGLKVRVWTVDTPAEIQRFKKLKVDGIISNFPDRF